MTFDARGGNKSSGGNNLVFGAITTVVVAGAFFAVLNLPPSAPPVTEAADTTPHNVASMVEAPVTEHHRLNGKSAKAYFATLKRVDAGARQTLDARLASAGTQAHVDIVMAHASEVMKAHAGDLAKADTRHLDAWLDMTRNGLKKASRKNNEWCSGSRYAALAELEGAAPDVIARELSGLETELNDYAFTTLNHFMLAIEDARESPVKRGPVTPTDEAALQGVVMSMISDPQVLPLIMSAQSGTPPEEALKSINVCDLAATAVTAVKTLPQDTKGRVFAEVVSKARFEKGDLNAIGGFPGF